eukprot:m.609866 g.609866  ORF g.609866 m.609866 type:complete len:804 (-) comp22492_c0_seq6:74-2485(-)
MGLFVPASWTLTSFSTCRTICILVVAQNLCSPDTVLAAVSCNTCNKQILNLTLERVSPSQYVHSQSAEVLLFWGSTAGHAALDLTARHNTTSYNLIDTFTNIQVGDTFTIPVSPSFPASIRLECNITGSLTMVSTVIFRTACDQPIYVGDIFGNFKVTGYASSLGVTFNASTDSCQFLDYPPPDLIHYVAPDTCEACNSTNMRALRNVTFMWLSLDSYAASVSIAGSDASTVAIVSHGRISYNSVFVQSGDNFTVDASQHSGGVLPGEVVIDVFSNLVEESTQVGCASGLVVGRGMPVAGGSLMLLSFSETVQNAEQICAEEGFGPATSTPSPGEPQNVSGMDKETQILLIGLFVFILVAAIGFVVLRCWYRNDEENDAGNKNCENLRAKDSVKVMKRKKVLNHGLSPLNEVPEQSHIDKIKYRESGVPFGTQNRKRCKGPPPPTSSLPSSRPQSNLIAGTLTRNTSAQQRTNFDFDGINISPNKRRTTQFPIVRPALEEDEQSDERIVADINVDDISLIDEILRRRTTGRALEIDDGDNSICNSNVDTNYDNANVDINEYGLIAEYAYYTIPGATVTSETSEVDSHGYLKALGAPPSMVPPSAQHTPPALPPARAPLHSITKQRPSNNPPQQTTTPGDHAVPERSHGRALGPSPTASAAPSPHLYDNAQQSVARLGRVQSHMYDNVTQQRQHSSPKEHHTEDMHALQHPSNHTSQRRLSVTTESPATSTSPQEQAVHAMSRQKLASSKSVVQDTHARPRDLRQQSSDSVCIMPLGPGDVQPRRYNGPDYDLAMTRRMSSASM